MTRAEELRPLLFAIAYRIAVSVRDAEEAVQTQTQCSVWTLVGGGLALFLA